MRSRSLSRPPSWALPFLLVLVAPVLGAPTADHLHSSRSVADTQTSCLEEAASSSGCNPTSGDVTAAGVIQCFCSNTGGFLDETARCVGESDEGSLTMVYATLSKNCAAAGREIAVSEEDFVAAGKSATSTTTKRDASPYLDLEERQTADKYGHQQQEFSSSQSQTGSSTSSSSGTTSNGQSSTDTQTNGQQTGTTSSTSQTTTSSSTTDTAAADKPSDSSGIPLGVKISIIAGCVIGSLAIVLPTFYICLYRIRRRRERRAAATKDAISTENLTMDTMSERPNSPPSRSGPGASPLSGANSPIVPPANYQWTLPHVQQQSMSSLRGLPSAIYSASGHSSGHSSGPRPQQSMSSMHTTYALGRAAPSSSTQIAAPLPVRASPQNPEGTWAAVIDTQFSGMHHSAASFPANTPTQRMVVEVSPMSTGQPQPVIAELPANGENNQRGPVEADSREVRFSWHDNPTPVGATMVRGGGTGLDGIEELPPPPYTRSANEVPAGVTKEGPGVRD